MIAFLPVALLLMTFYMVWAFLEFNENQSHKKEIDDLKNQIKDLETEKTLRDLWERKGTK